MSVEIRVETTYQVVQFLLILVEYHEKILNDELEVKAREQVEITDELENYSDLKIRLLLYLGKYSKALEVGFYERDIILLDKICYLHFVVTKKIVKVDKRLLKNLEQFYEQIKEWIMVLQGDVYEYLN